MSTKLVEFVDGQTPLNAENLNSIGNFAQNSITQLENNSNISFAQMRMMFNEMVALFGSPITVGQVAQLSDTYGLRIGHTKKLRPASLEESMPTVARIAIVGRTILTGLARSL